MNKSLTKNALQALVNAEIIEAVTPALEKVAEEFAVVITPAMKKLIDANDDADPIAAQFIPSEHELFVHPDELADPISDNAFSPVEGIVHRHSDRVLLKLLHACAVHCRFCFRREQIGQPENLLTEKAVDAAFAYIEQHQEIWEVILTGGDPLLLSDRRLADIVARLNSIPHVKIIRIHTRIPVVDPARITRDLVAAFSGRAAVYVLLHCNHPRELTGEARVACARFIDAGIPMLSQSVLLRGVNDNAEILAELMKAFVENRIKPHYLHHGDLARGTSHFRVPIAEGQKILRSLRNLSGLCQPSYMLDIPGGFGKVPMNPVFVEQKGDSWMVEDPNGRQHNYRDVVPTAAERNTKD
jgi:lysine 2,3-aminomutase